VPRSAGPGSYRFRITANRYELASEAFRVAPFTKLVPRVAQLKDGVAVVALDYPDAVPEVDLTYRPKSASGGNATFDVDGRTVRVGRKRGLLRLRVRSGQKIVLPKGAGRDRYGNRTGEALEINP
jgi:hypothetical protein